MLASHSLAARPAPAYLHSVRSHLRTPNRGYVGYVGNTLSLIGKAASTSGACVLRHRHLYNRLGDFFGRWRLAVAEQAHTRLAARTLGLAAALALREWCRLPPAAPVGLRELPPQLLVGHHQLGVLLLKPRNQCDNLIALRRRHAFGPAHSPSLSQRPAFTATPLRATNPLINYVKPYDDGRYYVSPSVHRGPVFPLQTCYICGATFSSVDHVNTVTEANFQKKYSQIAKKLERRRFPFLNRTKWRF